MSKRVSIVLPDEMPLGAPRSQNAPQPKPKPKSSLRCPPSLRADLVPPVFVVVSPEGSGSSEASSRRTSHSSASNSSLNNWVERDYANGGSPDCKAEATAEPCALTRTGSSNVDSNGSSIKQFLRSTVALVRAGESFTSVKQLFYKFIKSSSGSSSHAKPADEDSSRCVALDSSPHSSQLVRMENPYLSQSNDTLLSNCPPQFTVPSTSQITTSPLHSDYSFNPWKYDLTSRLSDVTPLTGYTPRTAQVSAEDAGSQETDASMQTQPKSGPSTALVRSEPLLARSGLSSSPLRKHRTPGQPRGRKEEESTALVSAAWSSRSFPSIAKPSPKSSPRRSPKMSPRSGQLTASTLEPAFVLVSSSRPHSEGGQSLRSSGSGQGSLGSDRHSAREMPRVSSRNSATSGVSQNAEGIVDAEPKGDGVTRSSEVDRPENMQQKRDTSSLKVDFVFALVSPEEAEPSQPGEPTSKDVEEGSSCVTYQEECKCHHCQDMRRAMERLEYFRSPEGQKRMEAKLLAKNFFMDLCALSKVRKQIQADLHGTRTHPPARVSYPVSICGATRLDGGSLTLKWFTHDLDCVDHFDFFVDGKPSRSVFNPRATTTVLIDVNASETHRLRMRAVPVRGCGAQASPVDKLMSEVVAGHMRHVRQGQLFASCLELLDAQPQERSLVDFWTDSEFLYMPTCPCPSSKKGPKKGR